MMHGEKMGHGHHMGHWGHGHYMGGHVGKPGMRHGMGMMGAMGGMPMGMMGGPMGMHGPWICPWCGADMMGYKKHGHKGPMVMAKIAKKELLYEKIKAKMDQKYGDTLDKMADEIVNFAEEKKRMKRDLMKKKMEMRQRMLEFYMEGQEEEGEEEE